jgi:hypothetical protein
LPKESTDKMTRSKGQDNMGTGRHSGMAHGHGHGARSQAWEHARAWAYAEASSWAYAGTSRCSDIGARRGHGYKHGLGV